MRLVSPPSEEEESETTGAASPTPTAWADVAFRWIILIVFFVSGASSLIYQVAWQRALTLHYGVGSVSIAVIVSVFLFGLGAGALFGGWLAERVQRRLWTYFIVEFGIGLSGLASLPLFEYVFPLLTSLSLFQGFLLIAFVMFVPTAMMGMTLPLVLKLFNETGRDAGHSLSLLYFVNTLGAAIGSLIASYLFLSFIGITGAVVVAAILNFALATLILLPTVLDLRPAVHTPPSPDRSFEGIGFDLSYLNYLAVLVTGFLAIGYQMIWFRYLGTLLKPSAYVFSTILAMYLLGIALGSYWMSRRIKTLHRLRSHKDLFFKINTAVALVTLVTFSLIYWGAGIPPIQWMLETTFAQQLHPPNTLNISSKGETGWQILNSTYALLDIVLWPLLVVLPSTFLMGASFPLIAAMATGADPREGWKAGTIYATNIIGNVLGALVTGLVLFPLVGTELTLLVFTLVGTLWIFGVSNFGGMRLTLRARSFAAVSVCMIAVAVLPGTQQLYLTMHPDIRGLPNRLMTENIDGVVVTYRADDASKPKSVVYISGSRHANFPHQANHVKALETVGHARAITKVLVIGFGGGDLTNVLLKVPDIEDITVVEISHALVDNIRQLDMYQSILGDRRLRLEINDGRRYLQVNDEKYDVVVMDPLRSTTSYSNNIYSKEFFELVRARLKPGGILMTWMDEFAVIPSTLASVFEHMKCFYYICLSSTQKIEQNEELRQTLWSQIDEPMQKRMQRYMEHYESGYKKKGGLDDIERRTGKVPVNRDLHPVTEYYIGYNLKRYLGWF